MKMKHITTALSLLLALAVLFSACAKDDGDGEDGSTAPANAQTASVPDGQEVTAPRLSASEHIAIIPQEEKTYSEGDTFTVDVYLNAIDNVASFNLDLAYDKEILELVRAKDGSVQDMQFITNDSGVPILIGAITYATVDFAEEIVCTATFRVLKTSKSDADTGLETTLSSTPLTLTPRAVSVGLNESGDEVTDVSDQMDVLVYNVSIR